jgi:hypothetical protein
MSGSGKGGKTLFFLLVFVSVGARLTCSRLRCCMLYACTADDAIAFVVMFCFWCYLGQAYPGYGTAPCQGQPPTGHRFCRIK